MKKLIAFILAVAVTLSAAVCVSAGSYVRGDADGSGYLDIIDATVISRFLVNMEVLRFFPKYADVDDSGDVEITDATLIQRSLASISTPYDVGGTVIEPDDPTEAPTEAPTQPPTKDPNELPFIPKR